VIYKNNKPFMVLGSPAGRRQQGAIIQTIVHVIDHDMGVQEAISAPRIHCEGNKLWMESRISEEIRNALRGMGHDVIDMAEATMFFGGLNAVKVNQQTGHLHGGADIRRPCSAVGY
jgi:gamma-glutamyltranspeptidase/glutathione hydrolase